MAEAAPSVSTIDGYKVGKTLGSGFSAKVKLVTDQQGDQFAMKVFLLGTPQFDEKAFKLLKEEVQSTADLKHNNVVQYREFKDQAQWYKKNGSVVDVAYIVQELIPNGELFDYVANTGPFAVKYCKYFFKQMLQGLNYIHSKGFSHRDLKPENILLDKNFNIKIVDFGFSCPLEGRDGSGTNKSVVGTPGYMAPEIFLKQPYQGQVVDLFALGVILFIMYSGHPPFAVANEKDNHYKLLATNRSDLFWKAHQQRKAENFFSEEFKNLITCMLQFHPHQRLCIADIIGHPWLQSGGIATTEEVLAEFNHRHEVNKKRAEEERERKDYQRNQVNRGPHRDLNVGGKVFLSHGEECKADQDPAKVVRLQLKEMDMTTNHRYAFFSEFAPDVLMEQLTQKLEENSQTFEMSDKTWKLNFKVEKQINEYNEDEEEEEVDPIVERATVQVQVLKVPEQNKYCVEFQRKAGSAILFYNHANKYIDLLELCNNTRIDEAADNAVAQQ